MITLTVEAKKFELSCRGQDIDQALEVLEQLGLARKLGVRCWAIRPPRPIAAPATKEA